MIGHAQIDVAVIPEPICALVPGHAECTDVDEYLQSVQIMGGLFTEQAVVEHGESADAADSLACFARERELGDGGCERRMSSSHRGVIHRGVTPLKINPATIDLCESRATSNPPGSFPVTAIIAALTDSELPQVEKNAWSARTASAISCSAAAR